MVVRYAVYSVAADSEGQLVSIKKREDWDPVADIAPLLRVSMFFGNTLYLIALGYYTIICFLGYNGKPAAYSAQPDHR